MKLDIIISGVGGQGILSIAAIIGHAALAKGWYIKQAEVHGMSQRGGDVQSNLRISDQPIASDLIARRAADIVIALEPMEALRYVPYLTHDGVVVSSSLPFVNIPTYPDQEKLMAELRGSRQRVILLDVEALAQQNEVTRAANMVLLGAAAGSLGLDYSLLEQGVASVFGAKGQAVVDMNIKALEVGRAAAQ
ncbi:MAG: indolepyruvate oxidoreductase subunit beta [Mucinivorans sp.]